MAKKKQQTSGVVPMSDLVTAVRGDLLELASSSFEAGRKAYVVAAKCCIALTDKLEQGETLYGVLRGAGLKDSQIANGRQLGQVWETWVRPDGTAKAGDDVVETGGKMSEEVFDNEINFSRSVALNKLTRKNVKLAEAYLGEPDEWSCLADNGMTRSKYDEYRAREAEAEAERNREARKAEVRAEAEKIAAKSSKTETETEPAEAPTKEPTKEPTKAPTKAPTDEPDKSPAEPEASTPEPEAPNAPDASTETNKTEGEDESKVVHMDRLPALSSALDNVEQIAVEIARDQPEAVAQAREVLRRTLESLEGMFEGVQSNETEAEAKSA